MSGPRIVRVGIVGGGLMGREIAAALQRWPALIDHPDGLELGQVPGLNDGRRRARRNRCRRRGGWRGGDSARLRQGMRRLAQRFDIEFMLEPMQVMLIEAPVEFMGAVTALVGSMRGQLQDMNQEGSQVNIKAKLPVMNMLGWSSDLRSATEGRGVSSLVDQSFERLPSELQPKVIGEIKQRKGLSDSQLGA